MRVLGTGIVSFRDGLHAYIPRPSVFGVPFSDTLPASARSNQPFVTPKMLRNAFLQSQFNIMPLHLHRVLQCKLPSASIPPPGISPCY